VKQLHSGDLIEVHRASMTSMSGTTVSLSNGETKLSDAVVFATGWDYKSTIFDTPDAINLGVSDPLEDQDEVTAQYWDELHVRAKREILGNHLRFTRGR
jgi:dimethylaniline monooxygenase (N-oxide forming)